VFNITCMKCGMTQTLKQETIQDENWGNDIQLDCFLNGRSVMIVCTECKNEIKLVI
jgi:hypothetical protein